MERGEGHGIATGLAIGLGAAALLGVGLVLAYPLFRRTSGKALEGLAPLTIGDGGGWSDPIVAPASFEGKRQVTLAGIRTRTGQGTSTRTYTLPDITSSSSQAIRVATDVAPGGGDQFDASSLRIANVADPTSAQDAATKAYVDLYIQGVAWKNPVRSATTGVLPSVTYANGASGVGATLTATANGIIPAQDGVTQVNGDRLLVKNQAAGLQNGLYVVTDIGSAGTPFILTRATDADIAAELLQAAVFVSEGSTQADSAFVDTADAPITVGTTALTFVQFSSTVAYTFDQGLLNTAGAITVDLDTAAAAQAAGAAGGSSGLEFDVNTAAGKLRAAVNATGGLERSATGLAVLDDPQANQAGNNPSVATTAAGTKVLRAPIVNDNYTADASIAVGDPILPSTTNNRMVKAQAGTDALSFAVGVAVTAAAAAQLFAATSQGIAPGVLVGATAQTPYYLSATGGMQNTLPGGGNRTVQMGIAINATDLFVQIRDFGKKA